MKWPYPSGWRRWALGALAFWPFIASWLFFDALVGPEFLGAGMVVTASMFVSLIYFFLDAAFGGRVPEEKVRLWLALFFFANIVVLPFYWYFYVWSARESEIVAHDGPA